MAYETLTLEVSGALATLTLNRPKALNALNASMLEELGRAIAAVHDDAGLRALIVTGAGDKAFVAGADIAAMAPMTPQAAQGFSAQGQKVFAALEALRIPTIAAVNGYALGGGCELALACDLIYASEKAKLGLPEVTLGVIPGFGGTQRLTRLVGRARAKELILTGALVDARQAKAMGLVLEVFAPEALMPHCIDVASKFSKAGPRAVAMAKSAIDKGAEESLAAGQLLEQAGFAELFQTQDQKEGMAAFLEKRPPMFSGH